MIRGAIAFALVLNIPYINESDPANSPSCPEAALNNLTRTCFDEAAYKTMVSTTLILVMATTLIFGTFMSKVQQILVPATVEDKEEYLVERRTVSLAAETYINRAVEKARAMSHYEEILHPNEINEEDDSNNKSKQKSTIGWVNSKFVNWFLKFDEEKLRPFFIRKYDAAKAALEDEQQELIYL